MTKISELQAANAALRQRVRELEARQSVELNEKGNVESNDRFHSLFETMAQGVVYQDISGAITLANPAAEQILGVSLDEMQGRKSFNPRWRAIHEDGSDFPGAEHPAMIALKSGQPVHDTVMGVFHPKKNEYCWIRIDSIPEFRAGESLPYQVYSTFNDITDLRRAEERLRKSEARYRLIADNSSDVIWVLDPLAQKFTYVSPSVKKLRGYSPEEVMALPVDAALTPESLQMVRERISTVLPAFIARGHGTESYVDEVDQPHKDGHIVHTEVTTTYLFNEHGQVEILGVSRDITERKQAEEKLRESEAWFHTLFENLPMSGGIYRLIRDAQGEIIDWEVSDMNRLGALSLGGSPSELIGKRASDLFGKDVMVPYLQTSRQVAATGEPQFFETHFDTNERDYLSSVFLVGKDHYATISVDITVSKQADLALQKNERLLRMFVEHSPAAIAMFDQDMKYIVNSRRYLIDYRLGDQNLVGRSHYDVFPEMNEEQREIHRRCLAGAIVSCDEDPLPRPDGTMDWVRYELRPWYESNNAIGGLIFFSEVITERKQNQEKLRESEERFRSLFDNSGVVMLIIEPDSGRIMDANPAAIDFYGYSRQQLSSMKIDQINQLPPDQVFAERQRAKKEERSYFIFPHRLADGQIRTVEVHSHVITQHGVPLLYSIIFDITERQKAQQDAIYRQSLLEKVLQFGKNVTAITNLDLCLREIHSSIKHGLGFDRVGIFLYDTDNKILQGTYGTSPTGEIQDNSWYDFPLEEWPGWQTVLQNPTGLSLTEDYQTRYNPPASSEMYGVKQHATLAAWVGEIPVALLAVDNLISNKPMHPADLQAVQLFAGYAGLAIANAQLNTRLEQRIRERTAEIEATRQRLELATQVANLGIWDWHIQTGQLFWDEQVYSIYRVSKDDFPVSMESFMSILHPEDIPALMNFTQEALAGQIAEQVEYRIMHGDGTLVYVKAHGAVVCDADGLPRNVIGVVQDITPEKMAEQALRESEEIYRALFENANDAIFLIKPDGIISRANMRCAELLGYSLEELIGRNSQDFIAPGAISDSEERKRRLHTGEYIPTYERQFICKNGEVIDTEINLSLITDTNGQPKLTQSVVRDITARKKAEQVLRESRDQLSTANAALEKASRLKDEFLASMSHELRTPLTSILGLSEVLQMQTYGPLSEKQLKALKNVENSGRHLLALINDILDLSKIEAGKIELQFDTFALADICQSSLQLTKSMALDKEQHVSYSIHPEALVVNADARRLKQMLVNLLSNAIKFTPKGGSLGLEVSASEADHHLALTVWDNGIGIAPEDIQKLFQPFVQLDSGLARHHNGTGLGLALVKRMAELHGGSVRLESVLGEGSRFTILLPWSPQDVSTMAKFDAPMLAQKQPVTGVEHQIDTEELYYSLNQLGITNTVYPAGQGTVELAARIQPDAILLDLNLPGEGGLELLAALKNHPKTGHIPLIGCSSEDKRSKALALGAAGYLAKPLSLPELGSELIRLASESRHINSTMTIVSRHTTPVILIADDNKITLDIISDFFNAHQYRVVTAQSGRELLELVPVIQPDIILMDIQMPEMDGLQTIRLVRNHVDPLVVRIPIIALTALAMPGDREICLKAGANDYLSKPVELKKLEASIRELLRKK
jgi:PAS domain S-box-containing protein